MKKLLGIVVLGLLWLVPVNANACTYKDLSNEDTIKCESEEEYIKLYKELEINPYTKYLLPKDMTVKQAQKLIKEKIKNKDFNKEIKKNNLTEKKKKEDEKKKRENEIIFECHVIAGNAKNTWSAKKIYNSCIKSEMN